MSSPSVTVPSRGAHRKSVALVFICTILGAAAQILMKTGAKRLGGQDLLEVIIATVTNIPLMIGYTLYGINTVLLVLALKDGELSRLYPIIALTYVWVTGLSWFFFHDNLNPFRLIGIAIIVVGVAVMGRHEQA